MTTRSRLSLGFLLSVSLLSFAQQVQQTPNLRLNLPPTGLPNWGNLINQNFVILDTAVGAVQRSYQGSWSATITYSMGQIVIFNGASYVSLLAGNVNQPPNTTPTAWGLIGSTSAVGQTCPITGTDMNCTSINSIRIGPDGSASPGLVSLNRWGFLTSNHNAYSGYNNLSMSGSIRDNGDGTLNVFGDGTTNGWALERLDNDGTVKFYSRATTGGNGYTLNLGDVPNYLLATMRPAVSPSGSSTDFGGWLTIHQNGGVQTSDIHPLHLYIEAGRIMSAGDATATNLSGFLDFAGISGDGVGSYTDYMQCGGGQHPGGCNFPGSQFSSFAVDATGGNIDWNAIRGCGTYEAAGGPGTNAPPTVDYRAFVLHVLCSRQNAAYLVQEAYDMNDPNNPLPYVRQFYWGGWSGWLRLTGGVVGAAAPALKEPSPAEEARILSQANLPPVKPSPAVPIQGRPYTPKTSKEPCAVDAMWHDANYLYVCVASGNIKRVRLTTF